MTATDIQHFLYRETPALVVFTKKDGTLRRMKCTCNRNIIPTEHYPKNSEENKPNNDKILKVYDLEHKGWRSFIVENVLTVSGDVPIAQTV
jgi:hypothetical protein